MFSSMGSGNKAVAARGLKRVVAGLIVAVSASAAITASAQPAPPPGGPGGPGGPGHHQPGDMRGGPMGGRHHGGGFGGPGMFMGSPEQIARGVDRMLDGLNATDAQRGQIKQIVQAAAVDLKANHEAGRGLRERGMQLFLQPTVDANAAEALRQQMVAQHDQASKRVLSAMIDISRVLTPEQRAKAGQRMKMRQDSMKERMQRFERMQKPRQ